MHWFIILLPFVAVHGAETSVEQELQAADKLIDRAIMVRFIDRADFDHTALAKVGQIALPPPQAPQAHVRTIAVKPAQLPMTIALPQTRGGYGVFGLDEIKQKEVAANKKGAPAPAPRGAGGKLAPAPAPTFGGTFSVPAPAPQKTAKTQPAPVLKTAPAEPAAKAGVVTIQQPKLKSYVSGEAAPKPKPVMKARPVKAVPVPGESPQATFALPSFSLPTLPTLPKSEPVKNAAAPAAAPAKVKNAAAPAAAPAKATTGDEKPSSLGPLAGIGAAGAAFALRPFK